MIIIPIMKRKQDSAKQDYAEIFELERMLKISKIPHTFRRLGYCDGFQVIYPDNESRVCDAIQSEYSYGGKDGLLELMGLTQNGDSVEGWLPAEEVYKRIRMHYDATEKNRTIKREQSWLLSRFMKIT